jgi:hypothetical protein
MSIGCSSPLFKILAKFQFLDLNKMLSYTDEFLPIGIAKIVQTSEIISSLLGYFTASAAYFHVSKDSTYERNKEISQCFSASYTPTVHNKGSVEI